MYLIAMVRAENVEQRCGAYQESTVYVKCEGSVGWCGWMKFEQRCKTQRVECCEREREWKRVERQRDKLYDGGRASSVDMVTKCRQVLSNRVTSPSSV